ncbi:LOW QUALITY PROTEIN: gamma-secretase subunit APH-1A [Serinus canaria]|uniref:LOW QUALITY PROTEIN: gamma-secretase subunit APH-1A n=1 Tax=Serinus canaria TaxID=9135 RepID=UPI0021CCD404|nr:LOW QUALITY PROTEIN: gamma-secretase subunit APH-1A [Serinus canaria]
MGAAVLLGCAAIALGPAAALVLLTVAAEPLLVIVLVAGAFFWLLSLLAASLLWSVAVQLSGREDAALLPLGAAAAVLLQELCRFACFKILKKADEGLATLSEDGRSPISLRRMAYVSGLSFGIISGVFSITNILADSAGPGTVGIHGDSPYYFITSAFLTMALVLLHTFWGIIFFDACERRRAGGLGLVVGSHLLTSGLTFLNPWYEASLGPIFILTLCTGLWAFRTAGGSFHNVLKCLSCKQEPEGQAMLYSALQVPPEG